MPYVQEHAWIRQFIKFGIIGTGNTILDFGIYASLTRFTEYFAEHILQANAIAFIIAVSSSYIWNRRWTFRSRCHSWSEQFPKFIVANLVALSINQFTLYYLVSYFEMYDLFAKLLAVFVGTGWNFYINRSWTFKKVNQDVIDQNV